MVGEEQERRGGPEFLALEQHGGVWPEKEQGGESATAARARELLQAEATDGVGDLIVILKEANELFRLQTPGRLSTTSFLPTVILTLIEKTALER